MTTKTELSKGTLFDPHLVADLVDKVKGRSSLAIMSQSEPIPFNGQKEFIFTMDSEVDVVAENGKKTEGGITLDPVIIRPIKIEYGARISDEFDYAAEEEQVGILKSFNDGFAKKVARGLDLMAMHGINPRTGTASTVIGDNNFDSKITSDNTVTFSSTDPDGNVETAVGKIQAQEAEVSGMIMAPAFGNSLSALKANNVRLYPELAWGANPGTINGLKTDINRTVSDNSSLDRAILGDFENAFKWGFAKEIPLEIIRFGDPDNSGKDLKGYNQMYIRAEVYIGWGILDTDSFALIKAAAASSGTSQTSETSDDGTDA